MALPRRPSVWDRGNMSPFLSRSGREPINPLRIARFRRRGLTYREIGVQIAREDGRLTPYNGTSVHKALREFQRGKRDEDGERIDWKPATNRRKREISLGNGIGIIEGKVNA